MTTDASGNLYIADTGNARVRMVDSSGAITTVAGTGIAGASGDTGPATSTPIYDPTGVTFDSQGNLYIDFQNCNIGKVTGGIISTITINPGNCGSSGQNLAVDTAGNLYIPAGAWLLKTDSTGNGPIVAGSGAVAYSGDGGPAVNAGMIATSVFLDTTGNVYVTDASGNAVRLLTPAGGPPVLSIASTHNGNFTQGQNSATYSLTVSNADGAGPTSGLVTVSEILPGALALASISGDGWNCTGLDLLPQRSSERRHCVSSNHGQRQCVLIGAVATDEPDDGVGRFQVGRI